MGEIEVELSAETLDKVKEGLEYFGGTWQHEIDRFGRQELTVHNLNEGGFGMVAYEVEVEDWGEMGREGLDVRFASLVVMLLNSGEALLAAARRDAKREKGRQEGPDRR